MNLQTVRGQCDNQEEVKEHLRGNPNKGITVHDIISCSAVNALS